MMARSALKSSWKAAGLAAAALTLAACSETIGGFTPTTHVAEVEADSAAQASNEGNIASLTGVIERNPQDAAAYNTRGVVYAKLGRYSNAIEDFTHTIGLDPNFSGAYTNRALAYRQMKKDNLALQDFNQAIEGLQAAIH
jgi:tetratricopeptide (TPR) repeat protein